MSSLPALDAHAHIETGIGPRELERLAAALFAMTRRQDEWDAARVRRDPLTAWGLGCHPGIPDACAAFDRRRFAAALAAAAVVGEVGLDARSQVPLAAQRVILASILEEVAERPRPVSIHSAGRTTDVVELVTNLPSPGIILHWWNGSVEETAAAVAAGCYFSLNGAEARRRRVISLIPRDRVLTETDYPFTRRQDPAATRPGRIETIERALSEEWCVDASAVRRQIWTNLLQLVRRCHSGPLLPSGLQRLLLGSTA